MELIWKPLYTSVKFRFSVVEEGRETRLIADVSKGCEEFQSTYGIKDKPLLLTYI